MSINAGVQPSLPLIHKKRKRSWYLLFYALPLMVVVFLFSYVPLFGWYLSLIEYKPGYPLFDNAFVGFKFFKEFFASADFPRVMRNTFLFSGLQFCVLPLPMIFAILLNEITSKRFRRTAQTVTTLPHFISWVTVYALAFSIFSTEGMLNQVLGALGMKNQMILTDAKAIYWFMTAVGLWKGLGWSAIIYIAAIAGLDQELYEAAAIDGAGRFRRILHITVPGLMPTFVVLMLLNVSNFVNHGFEQYFVFRNSIVANNIEILELFTYRNGLVLGDYSYASAVGIFKSVVSVMLLVIANLTAKRVRGTSIL